MGIRANSIGGEHLHKLFCLDTKKKSNVYRIAELAIEKLHRKCNLLNLHAILTMDILLYDEFEQLSAELLKILGIGDNDERSKAEKAPSRNSNQSTNRQENDGVFNRRKVDKHHINISPSYLYLNTTSTKRQYLIGR
jgi:hypothetical protein